MGAGMAQGRAGTVACPYKGTGGIFVDAEHLCMYYT